MQISGGARRCGMGVAPGDEHPLGPGFSIAEGLHLRGIVSLIRRILTTGTEVINVPTCSAITA